MTYSYSIYSDIISLGNGLDIEIAQNKADDIQYGQCCYLALKSIKDFGILAPNLLTLTQNRKGFQKIVTKHTGFTLSS